MNEATCPVCGGIAELDLEEGTLVIECPECGHWGFV